MSATTYASDAFLNLFKNAAATQFTSYAALATAVTDAEAGTITEASYTGYSRASITFGAIGAGDGGRQMSNSAAVSMGTKTDAGTIYAIALVIFDASTAGNKWWVTMLDGGDPLVFVTDASGVTGDHLTHGSHGLAADTACRVEQIPGGPAIPAGLSENTNYFLVNVVTDQIELSTTYQGSAVTLTAVGECMVMPLVNTGSQIGKAIDQNDTPEFAIGQIVLTDD